MKPEDINYKEENRYFVAVVERVLRSDPLLLPYFEDGLFKLIDKPEDEFMWFKPGISPDIQEFILDRLEEVLGENPGEADEDANWLWKEREKVKDQLENDPVIFPYIITEALLIRNSVDGFKIEIATDLPDEEAAILNNRIQEILVLNFGLDPEFSEPEKEDPEFDVAS
ncbi:MAG: hypothetical protein U9N73_01285 [Candidatus Auribacterota bacterium]|nr:hypothetical protein [Candidatus Auribacterota bacterium]